MKQGFSIIELMIAIAISAILAGMMYTCLTQSQRTIAAIERATDIIMKTIIIQKQMTRDISGAYIPLSVLEPQKSTDTESKQPSAKPDQQKQPSPEPQKKPAPKESDTAEQKEALKKALEATFNGIRENDQWKQLTIVTHNPLEIFWSNKAGRPKCRSEKVIYTLEQEKGTREPTYKLMRSTTYTKDNKEITQKHELATGIKKMDITYTCIVTDESDKKTEATEQKKTPKEKEPQKEIPPKKIVKTFSDWSVKEMNEDDIRLQKKIPHYVTILIELWSPLYDKFESFTYVIPIMWEELKFKPTEQKQNTDKKEPSIPTTPQTSKSGPLPAVSNKK